MKKICILNKIIFSFLIIYTVNLNASNFKEEDDKEKNSLIPVSHTVSRLSIPTNNNNYVGCTFFQSTGVSSQEILTDQLRDGSITSDKLASQAITREKIADNAVSYNKIEDGSIGNQKVADNSIQLPKFRSSGYSCFVVGSDANYNYTEVIYNSGGSDVWRIPTQTAKNATPSLQPLVNFWENQGDNTFTGKKLKDATIAKTKLAPDVLEHFLPSGVILPYAGTIAPPNWILCNGSAISRTVYSGLFSIISTTYGGGDGSTTFNIPDLRGRSIFGNDSMGGTPANRITTHTLPQGVKLGSAGGKEHHTLTVEEIPSHSHSFYTGTGEETRRSGRPANAQNGGNYQSISTSNIGDGKPHNIMPPFMTLNYIIKY